MDQVRREEDPTCDMPLSELYRWQRALQVPITELLVDSEAPLSEPVMTRARLLRVMKTVRAIKETAGAAPILRFATMLEQQLIEMMPELKDVDAWHSVGQRRSPNELGRAAERPFPTRSSPIRSVDEICGAVSDVEANVAGNISHEQIQQAPNARAQGRSRSHGSDLEMFICDLTDRAIISSRTTELLSVLVPWRFLFRWADACRTRSTSPTRWRGRTRRIAR